MADGSRAMLMVCQYTVTVTQVTSDTLPSFLALYHVKIIIIITLTIIIKTGIYTNNWITINITCDI